MSVKKTCIAGILIAAGTAFAFILPFSMSSFAGAAISILFILTLRKAGILNELMKEDYGSEL